ncbi:MAG: alkaline phosphatase family protein [Dehalococcoidia bacterium]|nr:alkaline phosphatase family protein [Dehalococcoidia bacterium]
MNPFLAWFGRHGLVRLSDEAVEACRLAARGLALFALGVFAVLVFERGAPRSVAEQSWETTAQYGALALVALGCLVAFKWEGIGGWLITTSSVALGVLASVVYEPRVALFGCLAFFVPGALFLVHWQHRRRRVFMLAELVGMAALLAVGAVASVRVYNHYNGPTHPESDVAAIKVDLAEWVWAGAVSATGFTVNARLADEDDGIPELVVTSAGGAAAVVAPAQGPSEETGIVAYHVTGLAPDTMYSYALRLGDHVDEGRRGSVRTFPNGPGSFTIALASCARTGSNGQVYDRIREAGALLFIVPGDIHYENISTGDVSRMRTALQRVLTSPAQQALYLRTPIAYVWDDHDFGGDGSDSTSPSRAAVQSVYREFVPHYAFDGREASGAVYQAFSIGRVRFIMTDTRSERSPVGAMDDPARTMLGPEQKAWLKQELLGARDASALTVWVNGIPWIAPAEDGRDDWGGYDVERREIADFIVSNKITNVAMLSGDAHMLAIDDGSNNTFDTAGTGPGFPVFHAAALDRPGKVKGGPYSEGTYPGGGQFGLMTVTDAGNSVHVEWNGKNYLGETLVHYEFEYRTGK